jgi:hypothetical protein
VRATAKDEEGPMLRTRRLRNALRAGASPAARSSAGELSSGTARPVIVAQVVDRLEDLTSSLDLGGWRRASALADDALGSVCDD